MSPLPNMKFAELQGTLCLITLTQILTVVLWRRNFPHSKREILERISDLDEF